MKQPNLSSWKGAVKFVFAVLIVGTLLAAGIWWRGRQSESGLHDGSSPPVLSEPIGTVRTSNSPVPVQGVAALTDPNAAVIASLQKTAAGAAQSSVPVPGAATVAVAGNLPVPSAIATPAAARSGWPAPLPANANLAQMTPLQVLAGSGRVDMADPAARAELVRQVKAVEDARLASAWARARKMGIPIRGTRKDGGGFVLRDFEGDRPVYHRDENVNAAISTATDLVRGMVPYNVDGTGVAMGLWEAGGLPRTSHQEFYPGRASIMDGGTTTSVHATHVAGTLIAAGYNPAVRGMAPGGSLLIYSSTNDISEMLSIGAAVAGEAGKINLSNHSYGNYRGWEFDAGFYDWYGVFSDNGNAADDVETHFGQYDLESAAMDSVAAALPYYLPFFSAGNHRSDSPPLSGRAWYEGGTRHLYDPTQHPAGDGTYKAGYDTIEGDKLGKNIVAVGAVTDAVGGGVRSLAAASIISFSSTGPADDGRIKPDIVADGNSLTSTSNTSDTATTVSSGTSMASPNASGSALLLQQYYRNRFPGQAMRASMMKGLIIHTADDMGNPGPDYLYGWGLMNTKAAADVIKDSANNAGGATMIEGTVTDNGVPATASALYNFRWDGTKPLRVTLCWTDPAGTTQTGHDVRTRALVNDLNLTVQRQGGSTYRPYVMPYVGNWTNAMLSANATTGVNTVDNVEQVYVPAAGVVAGNYTLTVNYAGRLSGGLQTFALIVTGQAASPEITVQEPAGTNLTDGASTLSFGAVGLGSSSAAKTVWVQNTGTANLNLTSLVKTSGNTSDFSLDTTGMITLLSPGATTNFKVSFIPSASGTRATTLQIGSDDSDENPFDISLSGTGQFADGDLSNLVLSAGTLNPAFSTANANYEAGVPSATTSVTVTPTARQTGATIIVNGVSVTSGTPSSPVSLNTGANTLTIAVTANGSTKNYMVTVNRTSGPEIVVEQIVGTGLVDGVSSVDFGSGLPGSAGPPKTFTIRNTGTANLTGLAMSKTGAHAADFTVSAPGATVLAPNASTTFTVAFTPGASGARTAALQIANDDSDENPFDISLVGTGANPAAQMSSPIPGVTLTNPVVTFNWTAGTGVTSYSLWIGSSDGGYDLYNGNEGTNRSRTLTLPDDGRMLYVSLHSLIGGSFVTNKYTYRAITATKAQITSPANGSTLTNTSLALTWSPGSSVTKYFLWVGSTAGAYDLYAADEGKNSARTVTVPALGGKVYVTLWSLIRGAYQGNSYIFNRATATKAALTGPASGSTLIGGTVNLTWSGGIDVSNYVVWVGSSYGGYDLAAVSAGTSTSQSVTVPQDGGPVYVTLWSLIHGAYQGNNYWFTTALPVSGSRPARLTSHANGGTLPSSSASFTWDAGVGATQYALWIGSNPDGYDLYAGIEGTNLSRSNVALPADGRRVFVTLHSMIGGAWQSNSYFLTCPTSPSPVAAQLTSHASGATLGSASLPLVWSTGTNVTQYALWLGNAPGGYDLHASLETGTSRTITVPTDGRPIYLTLYSFINGAWQQNAYWFNTFNNVVGNSKARLISPANGTALTSATTTFDWDAGSGVTHYVLWIGSSPGGYDLLASTAGTALTRTVQLPNDGRKIHVTLWSFISGAYQGNSYYFTALNVPRAKAAMISPANGSTFNSATGTFTWDAGSNVTQYVLWIGRMPGGYDLYAGLEGKNTTKTLNNLPTDGSPLYVTLWSLIDGLYQGNEYIYNAWQSP